MAYGILQDIDNIIEYLSAAEKKTIPELPTRILDNENDRRAFNQALGNIALLRKWNHFAIKIGPDPLGGEWRFAIWFYLSETGLKSLPYFD